MLRIGREMAEGLAAAHEHGPDPPRHQAGQHLAGGARGGRVKILDFGLARAAGDDAADLTQTGAIVGTPAYMAPEQARGEAVDHRCDLFSLGCVLYRLCTGRPPFQGNDSFEQMTSLVRDEPPPWRNLTPTCPWA